MDVKKRRSERAMAIYGQKRLLRIFENPKGFIISHILEIFSQSGLYIGRFCGQWFYSSQMWRGKNLRDIYFCIK